MRLPLEVIAAVRERVAGRGVVGCRYLGDDVVGAVADIGRGLAAGTAIPPERPVRMDRLDFFRGETLVAAVIPLDQVRQHPGLLPIARQAAGLERALERARQDERKCPGTQPRAKRRSLAPPLLGQGKVGRTGVPATETPFRLAVPRQHHRLRHGMVSASPDVDVRGAAADLDVEAV